MKIRTFFITFLAPSLLFLLAAQLANTILFDYKKCDEDILSLKLTVMLNPGLSDENVAIILSEIQELSGHDIVRIAPNEELARFKSKFGVDVMSVLSENPFGVTVQTSVDPSEDPSKIIFAVNKIKGVYSSVYPDAKRNEILKAFHESCNKYYILAFMLSVSIILIIWLSEHFEAVANSQIISENKVSKASISKVRAAFNSRSFVKGTQVGVTASALFLVISIVLDSNYQANIGRYLIIAAFAVLTSTLVTFLMQLIAVKIEIDK